MSNHYISSGNGIDLVILMDVSGSMSGVSAEICQILKYAVDALSSRDLYCVITFDTSATQLFPLQPMIASVKDNCKVLISNCFTGGSTNLKSGLELLIKVKDDGFIQNRPFKIIILSDGQPDNGCDGFDLVNNIYSGEIKPEVFSCTFGANVKADTLKRLLPGDRLHYYRHITNMDEFKVLISELGLDRNIVIGTNLNIKLENLEAISPLIRDDEIKIDQIKTGDIFSIPIVFKESDFKIDVSYKNLQGKLYHYN
jgi:hypothetical protein